MKHVACLTQILYLCDPCDCRIKQRMFSYTVKNVWCFSMKKTWNLYIIFLFTSCVKGLLFQAKRKYECRAW